MVASSTAREFIKGEEKFSPVSFWDFKQYTWGWGTKAPGKNATITRADADRELDAHLAMLSQDVNRYVTNKGVYLTQNQFDALTSLIFNLGSGAIFTANYNNGYPSGSTLYNKILAGDFKAAGERFGDFVKAGGNVLPGLVARRAREADLWFSTFSTPKKKGTAVVAILAIGSVLYVINRAKQSKKRK